jgi:3-oxoacyl-[acyl-carrier protein] reductase
VTDEREVNHLVADIERTLGAVHTLVVNATPKQPLKPIEEYDWAFYQSMLDFFVKSPYLLTRAVLPAMKQRKAGRIINITSEVFARGVGNFSAYVAAKGAQTGWTRSMATELAPWHVTVNAVAPGWIPVERHADDPQHEKDAYERLIPMGQFGTPEDVGGAVVFLSSDASRFVTGQSIHVNGGMTVF